jgi:putative toxin-antitoxin system antitoxin component (TIGR02293 family)
VNNNHDADDRLTIITARAIKVFGNPNAANRFLATEHQLLGGAKPLDVALDSTAGARQVKDILGRLQVGSAV